MEDVVTVAKPATSSIEKQSIEGKTYWDITIDSCTLRSAKLIRCSISTSRLYNCHLSNCTITASTILDSDLYDSALYCCIEEGCSSSSSLLRKFPPEIRAMTFRYAVQKPGEGIYRVGRWVPAIVTALRGDMELFSEALRIHYHECALHILPGNFDERPAMRQASLISRNVLHHLSVKYAIETSLIQAILTQIGRCRSFRSLPQSIPDHLLSKISPRCVRIRLHRPRNLEQAIHWTRMWLSTCKQLKFIAITLRPYRSDQSRARHLTLQKLITRLNRRLSVKGRLNEVRIGDDRWYWIAPDGKYLTWIEK